MKEASVVITHAGVGSIIYGLKERKPMVVAARRKEFKEHVNDHQMQILEEFSKEGYIIALDNFSKLGDKIEEARNFKPREFISNNVNFNRLLDEEISKF